MTNNEELIKHKIKVDDNITMEIAIPKVMNALQFKGITMKANKLFNLSEASVNILPKRIIKVGKKLSREQHLFLLRKYYCEKFKLSKIVNLFKEKFPDIEKSKKSLSDSIYNLKSSNSKAYLQVMKEVELKNKQNI